MLAGPALASQVLDRMAKFSGCVQGLVGHQTCLSVHRAFGQHLDTARRWNLTKRSCVFDRVEELLTIAEGEPFAASRRRARTAPTAPQLDVAGVVDAPRSFDRFYLEHHDSVARALALTLGDPALGVEAADEAMTRAYQRWSTVRTYANPPGWVYRVGLNWARSFLRRRKRMVVTSLVADAPTHDPAPADPALARALAELDEKHRSVVVLRYLLDWSVEQTADALDIAPGTVKSRLHRALAALEHTLSTAPVAKDPS